VKHVKYFMREPFISISAWIEFCEINLMRTQIRVIEPRKER